MHRDRSPSEHVEKDNAELIEGTEVQEGVMTLVQSHR